MGTQLVIDGVLLNGVRKDELECKIDEFDEDIARQREKLMMLAASAPYDVKDFAGQHIDWIEHCQFEVNEAINMLCESMVNRHLANIAVNHPEDVSESF